MEGPKPNVNHLGPKIPPSIGKERQMDIVREALQDGTMLPKTVVYEDIDAEFKKWVETELKIQYDGKNFPTMVLYTTQRFSEYSQTWSYTDSNKNLILNFKTITRENNPQLGQMHSRLYNIPGNRFYLMKRQPVLDDNGGESFIDIKMRQPMCIDLLYKVSIFTTNIKSINEFNLIVNDRFKARQAYITPNGYYMPMNLESITDKSSYDINDRQFYGQTFLIRVLGYVLTEDDFRIEEAPMKYGIRFNGGILAKRKATVEIEEGNPCWEKEDPRYLHRDVTITVQFPKCVRNVEFDIDMDFVAEGIVLKNLSRDYTISINGEKQSGFPFRISSGDSIKIKAYQCNINEESLMRIIGYDPDEVYDKTQNVIETPLGPEQEPIEYVVES